MPPRLIGLYALATMEREGKVYGYRLSERIAERTGGAWRPGAGAVYPSLRALADRGLAVGRGVGRRREYRITVRGRAVLRTVRRRAGSAGRSGPDAGALWAEIVGEENLGGFLVRRLERSLNALGTYLARVPPAADAAAVRGAVARLLARGPYSGRTAHHGSGGARRRSSA